MQKKLGSLHSREKKTNFSVRQLYNLITIYKIYVIIRHILNILRTAIYTTLMRCLAVINAVSIRKNQIMQQTMPHYIQSNSLHSVCPAND